MGRTLFRASLIALLLVPIAGQAADETTYSQLFYRDIADAKGVLGVIRNLIIRRNPDSVLVVFDTVTFAPPPGMNEFNFAHDFSADIPGWLDALETLKPAGEVEVYAATTLSGRSVRVGEPGWRESLEDTLRIPWWKRNDLKGFAAAPAWIGRLLSKVPGYEGRMLVLVTGDILPETWADYSIGKLTPEKWRRKLRDRGAYWNEEAVAAAARRQGATLDIVAPEARFGDFLPVTDIPEAPWAARPQILIPPGMPDIDVDDLAKPSIEELIEALREIHPDASDEELREMARRAAEGGRAFDQQSVEKLVEALRTRYPDATDEELREMAERMLGELPPPRPPTIEDHIRSLRKQYPHASDAALREMAKQRVAEWNGKGPAYRFEAWTPVFHPHYGGHTFFNTDCPSRYGYWPFARAAAATGGSYIFYPFPPVDFLDTCPYDPTLLKALAPEYDSRGQFIAARRGDPALNALCRAAQLVIGETPWSDGSSWRRGGALASGWLGFASASPLALTKRYRERSKPFDMLDGHPRSIGEWKAYGRGLGRIIPHYDRAIEVLDNAAREIADGRGATPHRRSMANLRLTRFWFEMSAFHLHALSLYLSELEKHVPKKYLENPFILWITYIPTIRMSDCLPGYEGVAISEKEDETLQEVAGLLPAPPGRPLPKTQCNILSLNVRDPRRRALRHPRQVMKNLDERLKPRALRMIDAGAEVMRHEGRSPWGWMVYYTDADTFIWHPVPENLGPTERPGIDPPEGSSTPRPKPRARGPGSGGR